MSRLQLLVVFFFVFFNVTSVHAPLHAIDDEKDFRTLLTQRRPYPQSPPQRDGNEFLATSFAKITFGAMLVYTCPYSDLSNVSSYKALGSMIGIQLITEGLYELVSYSYETWRQKSIQQEIHKLERDITILNKSKKKSEKKKRNTLRQIEDKIVYLSSVNPQEESIRYKNSFQCGLNILKNLFIGHRTIDLIFGGDYLYTFSPRISYTLKLQNINEFRLNYTAHSEYLKYISEKTKPHLSLIGTAATIVDSGWSLYHWYKYRKEGTLYQDTPIKCLVGALSSLNCSVLCNDKLIKDSITHSNRFLHHAIEIGYLKVKPPINSTMTAESFVTAVKKGSIKVLYSSPRIHKYAEEYIRNYSYYTGILFYVSGYACHLNFGNTIIYFLEGCINLYQERKKWFSRVHTLARDSSEPIALPVDVPKTFVQQMSLADKNIIENQTVAFHNSIKVVPQISLEATRHEHISSLSTEDASSKLPKKKTLGTPDKHLIHSKKSFNKTQVFTNPISVTHPSNSISERDRLRLKRLQEIQEIRLSNSAKRNDMETMRNEAILFVNGKLLDGGKIKISWTRGTLERKVTFENTHKQPLEKSSVYKGFKLTKALDALEQIYLDGWDEKNILAHLNGRYSLYNLPFDLLHILWSSPEVNMKKK